MEEYSICPAKLNLAIHTILIISSVVIALITETLMKYPKNYRFLANWFQFTALILEQYLKKHSLIRNYRKLQHRINNAYIASTKWVGTRSTLEQVI